MLYKFIVVISGKDTTIYSTKYYKIVDLNNGLSFLRFQTVKKDLSLLRKIHCFEAIGNMPESIKSKYAICYYDIESYYELVQKKGENYPWIKYSRVFFAIFFQLW